MLVERRKGRCFFIQSADIQHTTDDAYRRIRQFLLEEGLEEGARINQNALALQLGISRTPVGKALHMLESEGFIDNIPNKGFFVHTTTLRELTELFSLRQGLEMVAASSLASRGTNEQFDQLEALFTPFLHQNPIDEQAYFKADILFHSTMMNLCDNSLLHKINTSLQIMNRSFSFGLLRPADQTLPEHLAIVDALRLRDPIKVQEVARRHTDSTNERLMSIELQMRQLGLDSSNLSVKTLLNKKGAAS